MTYDQGPTPMHTRTLTLPGARDRALLTVADDQTDPVAVMSFADGTVETDDLDDLLETAREAGFTRAVISVEVMLNV